MPPDEVVVATTPEAPTNGQAAPAPEVHGLPTDAELISKLEKEAPAVEGAQAKPEADKAKDPKAKVEPEKPKESALMRSIAKRERDLVNERQAFKAQVDATQGQIDERIKVGIESGLKERLGNDPRKAVALLKAQGLTPQQIAEALVNPEKQTPEELATSALAEAKSIRDSIAASESVAKGKANETEYMTTYKSLAAKHPHIGLEWDDAEILQQGYKLAKELQDECAIKKLALPNVTYAQIFKVLDKRALAKQTWREEQAKAKTPADETDDKKAAAQAATKANGSNGSGNQGRNPGASATTTLGKGLSERQSVTSKDPVALTREEIIAATEKLVAGGFNVKPH